METMQSLAIVLKSEIQSESNDGAHGIGVQNVTSNCNVATLNSFFFSLYLARRETFIRW